MANGSNGGMIRGEVPIIGQAYEITACAVTVLLICKCNGSHPLLVMFGGIVHCPASWNCGGSPGCTEAPLIVNPLPLGIVPAVHAHESRSSE